MVPWKMALYWFMPALVKRRVGSESGTTDEEGTACCQLAFFILEDVGLMAAKYVKSEHRYEYLPNVCPRSLK
jgi:hypothetical protein